MKHSFSKAAAVVLASMFALSACAPPSAGDSQPTTQAAAPETKAETGTSAQEDQGTAAEETNAGGSVTITMAMTAPWDTFIPFNTTNGNTDAVLELMYDKLIVVKANGEHEPRLADEWEQDDETGKILTFRLNENAKWHDGEPVTAEDVVYSAQVASSAE